MTGTISDIMFRNLHQYMLGDITMEQAIDSIKSTMDEEIDILIEDNPEWEIEQYLNQ